MNIELRRSRNPSHFIDKITEDDIYFNEYANSTFEINRYHKLSLAAKAYLASIYETRIGRPTTSYLICKIPLIEEVKRHYGDLSVNQSVTNYYEVAVSLEIFYKFSKEYIEKEMFPYIHRSIEWMLEKPTLTIPYLFNNFNRNHMAFLLLGSLLSYLESLSPYEKEREGLVNILGTTPFNLFSDLERLNLMQRFPELKLVLLNK